MKNNTNKIINRIYFTILIIGIIMTLIGIVLKIAGFEFEQKIVSGFIFAGIVTTIVCTVTLIRRKTNAEYVEQNNVEIGVGDERSIQIRGKAHTISWHITEFILIIGLIIFWIIENPLYSLMTLFLLFFHNVSYYIAKAYYNKKM